MPGLSWLYFTANRPEMASPYPFLHFHCNLCGLCDRLLTETGSVKKRTSTLGVVQPACLSLNGALAGTFPQWGFFKRACSAVPAKGSTVGQLPIELQPLLCGGVGQIRPHNCLPSQTGTAASLHPPKPATVVPLVSHLWGISRPSDQMIVKQFYLCHCWGWYEWPLNWINMSSVHYVIQLPFCSALKSAE